MTMPVYRFRSIEDMNLHEPAPSRDLADRIAALWERSAMLLGIPAPRGLRKFRSIEEANAEQEAWTCRRIEQLEKDHASTPPRPDPG
jgi:hypothetical protein